MINFFIPATKSKSNPQPSNDVDVFLFAGQSNEDSKAAIDGTESYDLINENIQIYVKPSLSDTDDGAWSDYDTSVGNNISPFNRSVGERWYCDIASIGSLIHARTNKPFYAVKCAQGGTPLALKPGNHATGKCWSELSSDNYFEIFTERYYTPAINKLISQGFNPIIKGLIWHQGETDGEVEADALAYGTNISNFMTALRSYDSRLANLPLINCRVQNLAGGFVYIDDVRAGQDAYAGDLVAQNGTITNNPTGDQLSASINIDDLSKKSDNVHLNAVGQDGKGARVFAYLIDKGII